MDTNKENVNDKSPSLDRSLIEELHNLDGVALSNLEDWKRKVGGSTVSVDTLGTPDVDVKNGTEGSKEWSPGSSEDLEELQIGAQPNSHGTKLIVDVNTKQR